MIKDRTCGDETIQNYKECTSALVQKTNRRRKTSQNVCTKFPVPIVTRPTSGKTGGKFRVKLQEHMTEVEYNTRRTFPRSPCASSLIERNKSTLTDHTTQENHVINWSQATVIDREPERFTRWIKEAIHIRKEGQHAVNRDEGNYQLSHAFDRFLDTASSHRVKNRKN